VCRDKDAVEFSRRIQRFKHHLQQFIERLGRDRAVRDRARRKDWNSFDPFLCQACKESTYLMVRVA
jgi:hypothetical protein